VRNSELAQCRNLDRSTPWDHGRPSRAPSTCPRDRWIACLLAGHGSSRRWFAAAAARNEGNPWASFRRLSRRRPSQRSTTWSASPCGAVRGDRPRHTGLGPTKARRDPGAGAWPVGRALTQEWGRHAAETRARAVREHLRRWVSDWVGRLDQGGLGDHLDEETRVVAAARMDFSWPAVADVAASPDSPTS
jgi:hypothetical protein